MSYLASNEDFNDRIIRQHDKTIIRNEPLGEKKEDPMGPL